MLDCRSFPIVENGDDGRAIAVENYRRACEITVVAVLEESVGPQSLTGAAEREGYAYT